MSIMLENQRNGLLGLRVSRRTAIALIVAVMVAFAAVSPLAAFATAEPTPTEAPSPEPTASTIVVKDEKNIIQETTIVAQGNVQSSQTVIEEQQNNNIVQQVVEDDDEEKPVAFFKTDDRESIRAGEILTYRLVIRNPHDEDLTDVRIVDHVPPYIVPLSTNPQGKANAGARTLTWDNQTISAKSEITFAFRARVSRDTPDGFLLQNVADVSGPGVRLSSTDSTRVIGAPRIAAAQAARPVRPVPTTAQTGTALDTIMQLVSVSGALATAGTLVARRVI